jgi:hypothetical protein
MENNTITGNYIASNLADLFDTATPGRVGININSGGGGSPVTGTVITFNIISDEDVDIAINTPAKVEIHTNNLLGGKIGVANVCAFDGATICGGVIDAKRNYWGARMALAPAGRAVLSPKGIARTFSSHLGFRNPSRTVTTERRSLGSVAVFFCRTAMGLGSL